MSFVNRAHGQITQIVITTIEQTDRTFDKKDELFLETRATKNQIIYTIDTLTQKLITKEFLIETYYSVWDGDKTIKEQVRQKHKKWKHEISQSDWKSICEKNLVRCPLALQSPLHNELSNFDLVKIMEFRNLHS